MDTSRWKVTKAEYFGNATDIPQNVLENAQELLRKVNIVREEYGKPMIVSSGYRDALYNASIGGAKRSAHISGKAVDFRDRNGELCNWLLNNLFTLSRIGLYMENPMYTRGWVHLDTVERRNVVFLPYSSALY